MSNSVARSALVIATVVAGAGTSFAGSKTFGGELAAGAGAALLAFDPCGGGPPSYHPGCDKPLVRIAGPALQLQGMGGVRIAMRRGWGLFVGGGALATVMTSSRGNASMLAVGGGLTATFRGISAGVFFGGAYARAHVDADPSGTTLVRTAALDSQTLDGGALSFGGSLGYAITSQLGIYARADANAMMHGNMAGISATLGLAAHL